MNKDCNRTLKNVILGAARTVIDRRMGVLYQRYQRWMEAGLSAKNARRNVARDIAAILLSMWKTGGVFDETLIGGVPGPDMTEGGGF